MKFLVGTASADKSPSPSVFVVTGDKAVNLTALDPSIGSDLMNLIDTGDAVSRVNGLVSGAPSVAVADITPALPVAKPGKTICLGLNYTDHIKEGGYDVPDYPALFMRGTSSLMAAGAPMIRPSCSEQLDYEVELMVIIGKRGKHIAESGPIGPYSVTPDELPKGAEGLKIETRVGDEILQSANTSEMLWPVARTIATISEYSTLEPGDYIAMGTPPGVGHARTPQRWLRPGETVEVEVEGIGICASPIVAEDDVRGSA